MNTIDVLGEEQTFAQIVNRTIQTFEDDEITSIEVYAFQGCTALTTADFSAVTSIKNSAFRDCANLTALILRANQAATLANVNAFAYADNAIIYVPDDLVDSYKAASNWSGYASRIKGISELPAA